ncbi:MAG: hypothetical protein HW377_2338 [Actinobacteria bacterium]|nr:hypothetical protein [Actinomycetota bacterium]
MNRQVEMNSFSRLLRNGPVVTQATSNSGFFAPILYRIAVTAG